MDSATSPELWLELESGSDETKEEGLTEQKQERDCPPGTGSQVEEGQIEEEDPKPLSGAAVFSLNSSSITQGGLFEIRCFSEREEAPSIRGNIDNIQPFMKTGPATYTALIPTDYLSPTGTFEIVCGYEDDERSFSLVVEPRNFHTQYLEIDESIVEETKTDEAVLEFNNHYYAAITDDSYEASVSSISQMDFLWPTKGIITTTYGEERYINGEATNVYHRGVDIAGDLGDEIYAAADGRVNIAKNLISSGNTVILSHGLGVYTSYFHLDELAVEQGALVKKGDLIGYQGTTGFSNGVHLHFELSVRDTTLEPGYFILGREVDY